MTLAVVFDSVGFGEWFVLLAVVLVVVGPKRLPSAARTLGQYYSRFRRAAENFKRQLMDMDSEVTSAVRDFASAVDPSEPDAAAQNYAVGSAPETPSTEGTTPPAAETPSTAPETPPAAEATPPAKDSPEGA